MQDSQEDNIKIDNQERFQYNCADEQKKHSQSIEYNQNSKDNQQNKQRQQKKSSKLSQQRIKLLLGNPMVEQACISHQQTNNNDNIHNENNKYNHDNNNYNQVPNSKQIDQTYNNEKLINQQKVQVDYKNKAPIIIKSYLSEQLVILENNVAQCRACDLCNTRTNVVVSRGNPQAKWLLVGEAPGEQEDLQGKPFVGMAGKLMDKMIAAMGLDVDHDVYICNVVKCRPPKNRNPSEEEINKCKHFLFKQIDLIKPQMIICFGRFAAQTVLSSTVAIGKLRKILHNYNKTKVVVSYHPAYLLRNPSAKKDAWEDLQFAMNMFN